MVKPWEWWLARAILSTPLIGLLVFGIWYPSVYLFIALILGIIVAIGAWGWALWIIANKGKK